MCHLFLLLFLFAFWYNRRHWLGVTPLTQSQRTLCFSPNVLSTKVSVFLFYLFICLHVWDCASALYIKFYTQIIDSIRHEHYPEGCSRFFGSWKYIYNLQKVEGNTKACDSGCLLYWSINVVHLDVFISCWLFSFFSLPISFFLHFLGGVGCAEVGKGGTTFVCLILIYFFSLTCCFRCDHVLSVKFMALGITQICSPFLSAAIHLFVSTYLLFSVYSCIPIKFTALGITQIYCPFLSAANSLQQDGEGGGDGWVNCLRFVSIPGNRDLTVTGRIPTARITAGRIWIGRIGFPSRFVRKEMALKPAGKVFRLCCNEIVREPRFQLNGTSRFYQTTTKRFLPICVTT